MGKGSHETWAGVILAKALKGLETWYGRLKENVTL